MSRPDERVVLWSACSSDPSAQFKTHYVIVADEWVICFQHWYMSCNRTDVQGLWHIGHSVNHWDFSWGLLGNSFRWEFHDFFYTHFSYKNVLVFLCIKVIHYDFVMLRYSTSIPCLCLKTKKENRNHVNRCYHLAHFVSLARLTAFSCHLLLAVVSWNRCQSQPNWDGFPLESDATGFSFLDAYFDKFQTSWTLSDTKDWNNAAQGLNTMNQHHLVFIAKVESCCVLEERYI